MRSIAISTIRKKFPNEWVLLADPVMEGTDVKGGIVLLHHKDKKELTIQGREVIGGHANYRVIFTGKLPNIHRLGILRKLKLPDIIVQKISNYGTSGFASTKTTS